MDATLLSIIFGASGVALGFLLGFLIKGLSAKKETELEKKLSSLEATSNDGSKMQAALEAFKASAEFKAMQEVEYRKGWETGQKDTLAQFQIQYEKFSDVEDKWISSMVETGYCMQLYYNGLPIGDPTKRILHAEKKVNKEAVKTLLETLDRTVNNLIEVAKQSRIGVKEVVGLIKK